MLFNKFKEWRGAPRYAFPRWSVGTRKSPLPPFAKGGTEGGFTLLELLIALALAAMLAGILAMGLNLLTREWGRASNRLDTQLDAALQLLQVEQALHAAFPHFYMEPDENRRYIYFEGDQHSLTWVSTVSPSRQAGLTAWRMKRGDADQGVTLAYAPVFAGSPDKALEKAKTINLFEEYQVSFEYLDLDERKPESDAGRAEWKDEWTGRKRQSLPSAVRVKLEKNDNPRVGLEIIALVPAHEHETLTPLQGR
jgi:general secretion pathway protein J